MGKFSKLSRDKLYDDDNPGPGSYSLKYRPSSPYGKFDRNQRDNLNKSYDIVGPGSYYNKYYLVHNDSPKYKFGSNNRFGGN